ncbi:UbiA prenyltransferase family protein [Halorubrum sp. DM2]|uniref:UbiA family prenyltransferase n=1 Tax=Halorubrum sp. DM2 TaxID=2527867 RepID=UPI0024B7FD24|nr:UbiA family prenyltransferase [Halorubrum sp. DM2]VTT88072.1 UbiA prenyltransferase family protein [Halorubrum sp. DM2]
MPNEPTSPSTPDGTAEQHRSVPTTRALRGVAAFAAGAPFTAVVAAVEVAVATAALGVPRSTAPVAVGLVAFAVYAADHVADAEGDVGSTPSRARIALRYGDQLMTAAAVSYGVALALAVRAGPAALALVCVPGAVWIGYASDWLPALGDLAAPLGEISVPRLKDVFLLNSAAVALAWAVAVVAAPLAFGGVAIEAVGTPTVALLLAYVAVRSFVDVEIPNVRDIAADADRGVSTLPVVCGVARTRHVLLGVDAVAAGLLAALAATGTASRPALVALAAGLAVSVAVTALADRLDGATLGVAPDSSYLVAGTVLLVLGW